MNTTANTTEHGYTLASGAGSDTRHIVAITGTYYGAYAPAAVCGTSPRIRFSDTRWYTTEDTAHATPAAAAAAANPATLCKRCSARAAAAVQVEDAPEVSAPAPAADTTEDAAYIRRVFGMSFPALSGDVVTQAHADYCTENGHATHTNDGVVSPWCPRCGASVAVHSVPGRPADDAVTVAAVRAGDVQAGAALTGYLGSDPVVSVVSVAPAPTAGDVVVTWKTAAGRVFPEVLQASHIIYTVSPAEDAAPATPAADIHPRALDLAAMVTPGAARVDLDPATAPAATYRTARAVVTAYFQGGPGRGECVDAVIITVTGGDSHPARMFAASDALTALQARVSGNITAGEYQTIASGDADTVFIYGTWTD